MNNKAFSIYEKNQIYIYSGVNKYLWSYLTLWNVLNFDYAMTSLIYFSAFYGQLPICDFK